MFAFLFTSSDVISCVMLNSNLKLCGAVLASQPRYKVLLDATQRGTKQYLSLDMINFPEIESHARVKYFSLQNNNPDEKKKKL